MCAGTHPIATVAACSAIGVERLLCALGTLLGGAALGALQLGARWKLPQAAWALSARFEAPPPLQHLRWRLCSEDHRLVLQQHHTSRENLTIRRGHGMQPLRV